MNKNIIVLIVIALLVGVGFALFLNMADDQDASEATTSYDNGEIVAPDDDVDVPEETADEAISADYTVTFTDNGYEPSTITIK